MEDKIWEVTEMVWACKRRYADALMQKCERLTVDGFKRDIDRPKTYWDR